MNVGREARTANGALSVRNQYITAQLDDNKKCVCGRMCVSVMRFRAFKNEVADECWDVWCTKCRNHFLFVEAELEFLFVN